MNTEKITIENIKNQADIDAFCWKDLIVSGKLLFMTVLKVD